jgi:hypothetical protein
MKGECWVLTQLLRLILATIVKDLLAARIAGPKSKTLTSVSINHHRENGGRRSIVYAPSPEIRDGLGTATG